MPVQWRGTGEIATLVNVQRPPIAESAAFSDAHTRVIAESAELQDVQWRGTGEVAPGRDVHRSLIAESSEFRTSTHERLPKPEAFLQRP